MYKITKAFAGLFFPNLCEVCDSPLVGNEHVFCMTCRYKIPKTNYWKIADNPVAQSFWGHVQLEQACAYFYFNKGSKYRKLLHKLKYKGQKDIAVTLGKYFGLELNNAAWCADIDLIVPVPLHPKKQRTRGYNQSECIAQGIAGVTGSTLVANNLVKITHTDTQTQKDRLERWQNVAKSFKVLNPDMFDNKHILLVDDTITTGATLEACAQALLSACNCKVSVVALAYVPK